MKRAFLASIATAIALSLAAPATVDAQGKPAKWKGKRIKKYDFTGENLEGDVVRPEGTDINTRMFPTHKSLIRIRQTFTDAIIKKAEDI